MELVQIYFTNLNKISIITGTVPVPISLHFFLLFFNFFSWIRIRILNADLGPQSYCYFTHPHLLRKASSSWSVIH